MDYGDLIIPGAFLAVIALLCALYAWSERQKGKQTREVAKRIITEMQEEDELERMWRISR